MGVKSFTSVFPLKDAVEFKDYKGKTIAVDAMVELYRSMLGIKNRQTLTDKHGRPTIHINVILCLILELYKNGIGQIWCFDSVNDDKSEELEYRQVQKEKAQEEFDKLDDDLAFLNEASERRKDSLRKRFFSVEDWMIQDIKFMLDCFNIKWMDSPVSYESEHLAACLTKNGIVDAVLTTDVDTLLFGATEIIKRDMRRGKKKKTYYKYNLRNLLEEYKISQNDLIKIGICLGNDFIRKGIPGIGPKTVLKKFNIVNKYLEEDTTDALSDSVKKAYNQFNRECPITNMDRESFEADVSDLDKLYKWLKQEKGYNIERKKILVERAINHKLGIKKSKKKRSKK